jgi:hypothetical protein
MRRTAIIFLLRKVVLILFCTIKTLLHMKKSVLLIPHSLLNPLLSIKTPPLYLEAVLFLPMDLFPNEQKILI